MSTTMIEGPAEATRVAKLTMVLIFGCDLMLAWPFQRASALFDVVNVVCGLGAAYLCWDARKNLQ